VSEALSTTRTEKDARDLLAVANDIWSQAGIEWYVERVIVEDIPAGAAFDSLLARTVPRSPTRLISFVPRDHVLFPGWNVFLIREFGQIAGGMYRPEIAGIVLAERGFGFELPSGGRGGATLAHELGHALGLGHETCDATRNIMSNACWVATMRSSLTPVQITRAREQAATGRPAERIWP
jgi:hypothetical protein